MVFYKRANRSPRELLLANVKVIEFLVKGGTEYESLTSLLSKGELDLLRERR